MEEVIRFDIREGTGFRSYLYPISIVHDFVQGLALKLFIERSWPTTHLTQHLTLSPTEYSYNVERDAT